MNTESPWLDVLTDYLLRISDIELEETSTREWLSKAALHLTNHFGPGTGIGIIRVRRGSPGAPWSGSTHVVKCGVAEYSYEWRRRYTSAVVSAQLTPADFMVGDQSGFHCWTGSELERQPKIDRVARLMEAQYGARSFVHSWRRIPQSDNVDAGALLLDFWTCGESADVAIPPKPIFRNITRILATYVMRIERHRESAGVSLMNRLTPCQQKVAQLLLRGMSERQVADELERSHHTIHQHVKAIYAALSVRSRAEFMARCIPVVTIPSRAEHIQH